MVLGIEVSKIGFYSLARFLHGHLLQQSSGICLFHLFGVKFELNVFVFWCCTLCCCWFSVMMFQIAWFSGVVVLLLSLVFLRFSALCG